MAKALSISCLALALIVVFSCVLHAQYGARTAFGGQQAPNDSNATTTASAPARDLQGVWMRRTPKGVFGSGATYTKDLPEMTPWGQEKFKAKDSNGGAYTLDQTNDPVFTRCYPPGVPRVYFNPYPFEFVQTPKYFNSKVSASKSRTGLSKELVVAIAAMSVIGFTPSTDAYSDWAHGWPL